MIGTCDLDGEKRTPFRALTCHLSGEKPVGGPRRLEVNNIEHDARDLGTEGTWTEVVIVRIGWEGMAALCSRARSDQSVSV